MHHDALSQQIEVLRAHRNSFDELETFFQGNSRVLKLVPDQPEFLLSRLEPTVHSRTDGPVIVPGIDARRVRLDRIFSRVLDASGFETSTLCDDGRTILISRQKVAPIEVVVKHKFDGSPKHEYEGILETPTRSRFPLKPGDRHRKPYVRFDWRDRWPGKDKVMPEGLAAEFINVEAATLTALGADRVLNGFLQPYGIEITAVCFFMNEKGNVICGEVSTDNTNIECTGYDPALLDLFSSKDKQRAVEKADAVLEAIGRQYPWTRDAEEATHGRTD